MNTTERWYESTNAGSGQGLVISEATGANICVTYEQKDAKSIVDCHNACQDNEAMAALRELDPDLTTPEIQLSEAARDTLISSLESHVGTTPWMQFLLECLQGRTIICQLPQS
jgi:hypothetical protein